MSGYTSRKGDQRRCRSPRCVVDAIIKFVALTPQSRSPEADEKGIQLVGKFVGPTASG
jgi:hypothetical protein